MNGTDVELGGTGPVCINKSFLPTWYPAEQSQSSQEAAPEEHPNGTGNVPVPSRAPSPAPPSAAMAQLWVTPSRDAPQVFAPS